MDINGVVVAFKLIGYENLTYEDFMPFSKIQGKKILHEIRQDILKSNLGKDGKNLERNIQSIFGISLYYKEKLRGEI